MSNRTIRGLFGGLGTVLILTVCAVVIVAHFKLERNLQRINVPDYVNVGGDSEGGYTFTLDVDRLLFEEHLQAPPDSELEQYPEIMALKTLGVRAEERNGAYALETISTLQDPHFNDILQAAEIKLVNTQWTWTKEQLASMQGEHRPGILQLRYADYVVISRSEDGGLKADLDAVRLMRDAGIAADADPETDPGARAIASLGIACDRTNGTYLLQATSTNSEVKEDLAAAGLQIVGTSWSWTEAEMIARIGVLETPVPHETPDPEAQDPETSDEPSEGDAQSPEETYPEVEDPEDEEPEETDKSAEAATPEPTATPAPTQKATEPARVSNTIGTLYGFDQTDVRKAIRAAKEAKYGSKLSESAVSYNYFAVGDASTAHGNVFRIVYTIKASKTTEYLIADVYDLVSEHGYAKSDVHLKTAASERDARNTDDLKEYKIYTLTGGSMVFEENKNKSPFDSDGLVLSKSLKESVTYDELWDLAQTKDYTLLQLLGYARNEMFARGGHKFKDTSTYYKHFKQFSWYKPTGTVTVNALAKKYPKTRDNITTIQFLEKLIKEG